MVDIIVDHLPFGEFINVDYIATLLSFTSRANALCLAEKNAQSRVSRDPSAGQLSGVLHP